MVEDSAILPKWLMLPDESGPPTIAVLETWQSKVPNLYNVSKSHKSMSAEVNKHGGFKAQRPRSDNLSRSMQTEYDCYAKTLLLLPLASLMKQGLQLTRFYRQSAKKPQDFTKLRDYIAGTWRVNPTLLNLEDELLQENIDTIYPDPWRLLNQMYNACSIPSSEGCNSLVDYTTPFFKMLGATLGLLEDHMTVYVSMRDIALTLEELGHSNNKMQPEMGFPKMFDRMHLSNIPDCLGMDLFTFTHASPLLKPHDAAFVTYNCITCSGKALCSKLRMINLICIHYLRSEQIIIR